jgi:hypothetical protein
MNIAVDRIVNFLLKAGRTQKGNVETSLNFGTSYTEIDVCLLLRQRVFAEEDVRMAGKFPREL